MIRNAALQKTKYNKDGHKKTIIGDVKHLACRGRPLCLPAPKHNLHHLLGQTQGSAPTGGEKYGSYMLFISHM
jgi:hypothetical protein